MIAPAGFTLQGERSVLTVDMPAGYVKALENATVHRDEGPAVVVLKCNSFDDAEALGQLFADAQRFLKASREE